MTNQITKHMVLQPPDSQMPPKVQLLFPNYHTTLHMCKTIANRKFKNLKEIKETKKKCWNFTVEILSNQEKIYVFYSYLHFDKSCVFVTVQKLYQLGLAEKQNRVKKLTQGVTQKQARFTIV